MKKKILTLISASLLTLPLLSTPVQAEEEAFELQLQQKLQQLLQLNREAMERVSPVINELQGCIGDQKHLLEEEFSFSNLMQAQRACTPLIEKMVSKLGYESEEEKEEATSQLYKALIKDSI